MSVELTVGRLGLTKQFLLREKVEIVPFSQRIQAVINSFVEYPAGPGRHASSPNRWYLQEWFDYQVQKMVGR